MQYTILCNKPLYRHTLYYCAGLFILLLCSTRGLAQPKINEVEPRLTEGTWLRIATQQEGVHKLSAQQLKAAGFTNPANVRIYGCGGKMLSERLSDSAFPYMLPQPTWIHNGEVYFFAHGPVQFFYDRAIGGYARTVHLYSTQGYYLVTENAALPAHSIEKKSERANANPTLLPAIRSYDALFLHEIDRFSPKKSGRLLFGEPLSAQNKVPVIFTLPQAPVSKEAMLTFAHLLHPGKEKFIVVDFHSGSSHVADTVWSREDYTSSTYLAGIYHHKSRALELEPSNTVRFDISIGAGGKEAFLDYMTLMVQCPLTYNSGQQLLFSRKIKGFPEQIAPYHITGGTAQDGHVWRVGEKNRVTEIPLQSDGSGVLFEAMVSTEEKQPSRFVFFQPKDAREVTVVNTLEKQPDFSNTTSPDYVILTTESLRSEAERLAQYHRTENNLNVLVVSQQEVFNRFSGGTPDATAYRLMMRYFAEKASSADYYPLLLLFGDGVYDNRKIADDFKLPEFQKTEFLLTYQGYNSTNVYSYTSDDYFGALDPTDDDKTLGRKRIGVGIGRLPLRTIEQAKQTVDKIIYYDRNTDLGKWKSRTGFVADNGDGFSHLSQADAMCSLLEKLQPALNISKVFMDAFPKETQNGLTSVPGAKRKLMEELNKGLLLLNYTGHGGPTAWADEQLLTLPDIVGASYTKLPVWITATCDFTNFDHSSTSAGEEAMLNPRSGAAALFTTTRVVMDLDNKAMNLELLKHLFRKEESGHLTPLGHVIGMSKNAMSKYDTINKLNFLLIGDPAIRLKMPHLSAEVTSINGEAPLTNGFIKLQAMQRVAIEGAIVDQQRSVQGDFNGSAYVTIYDAKQTIKALPLNDDENGYTTSFSDYPGTMYSAVVPVENGRFSFNFVVPKDISYAKENGRISLYAFSNSSNEAIGVEQGIRVIPGVPSDPVVDTIPPVVESFFLGRTDFTSGGEVGRTPLFVARISDETGLNLSGGGVGHDMTLVIDKRQDQSFVLNNNYSASVENPGKGDVTFMLPPLEEGDHTAVFTVWDAANNCTTVPFTFRVRAGITTPILRAVAYPTPLKCGEPMKLDLYNNGPGVDMNVTIELYNQRGRRVALSEPFKVQTSWELPAQIEWLPKTSYGTDLLPGVYIYRVIATEQDAIPTSYSDRIILIP